ncbi:Bifunctional pinoresinol-lariciresinol reductase [Lachnellula cervina]|uniref:Bifunctional pinoresinol-lariciresinol reductase n=1 Tax=Lachnellula cervina TaxID=1316786 RepID=A0A7D8YSW0_9HELO|nr:Bifunctional pinoresinol-lariciresinol reductase [Lachnellula cervina]
MSPFQNIALVGATGNLGSAILTALRGTSFTLTVLTRKGSATSKDTQGLGAKIIPVDYESKDSIAEGLEGVDAVICTIGSAGISLQINIIDAAIAAGVKRFIPSEFGADSFNERASKLPVFKNKVAVQQHLQEAAKEDKIEWTAILGGPFLDWGLARGLLGIHPKEKKFILYDGGVRPVSTTLLADLGKAVVGVLENPSSTRNRVLYIQSIRISQLEVLDICEDLTGSEWQRVQVQTADIEKQGLEKLGQKDMSGMFNLLLRAIFGEGYGCDFVGREENRLVKVNGLSHREFVNLVKEQL